MIAKDTDGIVHLVTDEEEDPPVLGCLQTPDLDIEWCGEGDTTINCMECVRMDEILTAWAVKVSKHFD